MTLKIRNRIFRAFLYFSIASFLISTAVFLYVIISNHSFSLPELRIPSVLNKIPFAPASIVPTFISVALLELYVSVVLFFICRYFENTQALEIIYFSAFLFGIICEHARFYTLCFGTWQTFTNLLIFLGNIVLFGRILSPLSFVCSSVFSEPEQQQDVERNYLLMFVAAFVFAIILPLNTAKITSTGRVVEGFSFLLTGTKAVFILLAAFSFYVRSIKHANREYFSIGIWMLVLYLGYAFLISADNYVFMILGAALLFSGTYFYLKNLHKMYMWI